MDIRLFRSGRPHALSARDEREVLRMSTKNPYASAETICGVINNGREKRVCSQTIRNIFSKNGLFARRPLCKPLISEKNRKQRLE